MGNTITDLHISQCIHTLLAGRKPASSICPSDAARELCDEEKQWRALMPRVREVAYAMARRGEIVVTQKGEVVNAHAPVNGAIRLRRSADGETTKP
jgi:Protein of unknown function (DUF3253)